MLAAMPRSYAAASGLATENQSVLVLKGAFLSLLTVLLQGALHVLELERVDSWSSGGMKRVLPAQVEERMQ